jgi:putative transposase
MKRGFVYLCAILDWATRRVLAWRLSNTLTAHFCVAALKEALARHGRPEIFNTDQGSQFTSEEFTGVLKEHLIAISMDGRGRCHDNIFVERLWWTVKHEWVYLRPAENGIEQQRSLVEFFDWYNRRRPHQSHGYRTPDEVYFVRLAEAQPQAA